jgi:hypothetical protein
VISPDAPGPFIIPSAGSSYRTDFIVLKAVRAVTERGDLKDRLWEVKETLFLPRKHSFASERHLCYQAMQKGYKTHFPP